MGDGTGSSSDGDVFAEAADRAEVDALFDRAYDELRSLAAAVRRSDAHATVNPTALVNEAWIKLSSSPPAGELSRLRFRRIAARAMRQVLVEAARRRRADKRGGGALAIELDGDRHAGPEPAEEVLVLDRALARLARTSARQAAIVEARYFGGLEVNETAELLGVSPATVERDWRVAKAWLSRELRDAR